MNKLFKINGNDNVAIALESLAKGEKVDGITLLDDIPFGHKVLLKDMKSGENIIKYNEPIGHLTRDCKMGEHIHEHNLKTNLSDIVEYKFAGDNEYKPKNCEITFNGYLRNDNKAATRNEIWIIPTVGCVNNTAKRLEKIGQEIIGEGCDGVFAYTHPFGCSQLGDDQENTRKILASLANHPNAGGVLILSLGCENTNVKTFKKYLGNYNESRIKFLVTQDCEDELEEGKKLIKELYDYVKDFKREPIPLNKLVIGYKCGGSDAFSGICANALCGRLTDRVTSFGTSAILTEVPEMFGAETILMNRCRTKELFEDTVKLINDFKEYFLSHGEPVGENPSPGNKAGGISTLEDKALGCTQKCGTSYVEGVLPYGERLKVKGLNLLSAPGNDLVAATALASCGCHMVLFTTGRGTPFGTYVPTMKISTNSTLAKNKPGWIDFNAGVIVENEPMEKTCERFIEYIIKVASGEFVNNEKKGYKEIAIFKTGVTL